MAIKGKGRTRARQTVRAPRRGPVPVPGAVRPATGRPGRGRLPGRTAPVLGGGLADERPPLPRTPPSGTASRSSCGGEPAPPGRTWSRPRSGRSARSPKGRPPVILPQVRADPSPGSPRRRRRMRSSTLRTAANDAKEGDGRHRRPTSSRARVADKGFDQGQVLRFLSTLGTSCSPRSSSPARPRSSASWQPISRGRIAARRSPAPRLCSPTPTRPCIRFQTHQTEALAAAGIIRQPTIPGA